MMTVILSALFFLWMSDTVRAQVDVEGVLAKLNALPIGERNELLLSSARKEGVVDWQSTLPVTEARELVVRFARKYPGIELRHTRLSGTGVVNRFLTEYKAGVHRTDVIGGRGSLHPMLMKAGVVARNIAPFRREIREEFLDKEGYYAGNFTYGLVFGYNVKNVAANRVPASYEDLLSPYWKGQMGLDRESYDWLGGVMDIMGDQKGLDYARKLSEQNLKIIKGHTLLTQLVAAGEIRLLIDAYHHHIVSFKEKGAPLDLVIPDPLIVREPSGIWISKKALHPYAAALLTDFLLSKEGQQLYLDGNRLVARKDMAWNFGGKKPPNRITILSEKWIANYGELARQFDQIFR
jgi:iron(III) transport system substrate-binding protein